jgi:hypothetical protein
MELRIAKIALLGILGLVSTAANAQAAEQAVSIKNPKAFAELLATLGYKPGEIKPIGGYPQFAVDIADQPTDVTFGGCSLMEDCSYIVLSSSYSDVKNPPAQWITKMNDAFDAIKIGLNSVHNLYFSATHMIEGVPRATLRQILDSWGKSAAELAQEAVNAKLDKAE